MFLPSFSAFLLATVGLLATACGDRAAGSSDHGSGASTATSSRSLATVVAGTGEVDAQWVARTRAVVDEELPKLRELFDGKPQQPFFVFVHGDRESLPDSLGANLHPESPAFALLGQHQIHMVWGEIRRLGVELHGVVRHELVHELLDQYAAPHGRGIPRWFHEGLAQHLAGDTYLRAREDDLAWRMMARQLPGFAELRSQFPSDVEHLRAAYAQSYSYVSWLAREYGLGELLAVVRAVDDLTPFEPALAGRLHRGTADLEEAWRHYVLYGSGAPWRVVFDQCFSLLLLAALPVLVLALRRHLAKESRAGRSLAETEARAAAAARAAELAFAAEQEAAAAMPATDASPETASPEIASPEIGGNADAAPEASEGTAGEPPPGAR